MRLDLKALHDERLWCIWTWKGCTERSVVMHLDLATVQNEEGGRRLCHLDYVDDIVIV